MVVWDTVGTFSQHVVLFSRVRRRFIMNIVQVARFFEAVRREGSVAVSKECPSLTEGNFLKFDKFGHLCADAGSLALLFSGLADPNTKGVEETVRNEMIAFGERYVR